MSINKGKTPDRPDMVEILRGGAKEGQVIRSCVPAAHLNDFAPFGCAPGPAAVLQARLFGRRRRRGRRRRGRRGCRSRRQRGERKAAPAATTAAGCDGKAGCKGKECQARGMHGMSLSVLVALGRRSQAQRCMARP